MSVCIIYDRVYLYFLDRVGIVFSLNRTILQAEGSGCFGKQLFGGIIPATGNDIRIEVTVQFQAVQRIDLLDGSQVK